MIKKNISNFIILPKFLKNVLSLSFGTIVGQLINLACLPILSRIYDPKDFGLFYSFVGISGTIGILSTLKYERAIILPKEDNEGSQLLVLNITLVLIFSTLLLGFLLLLRLTNFNFWGLKKIFFLIPISICFYFILGPINMWYQRKRKFTIVSIISISQVILILTLSLIFSFLGINETGLVLGYVFGCMILVFTIVIIDFNFFYSLFLNFNIKSLKGQFLKHIDFPKYFLPYDLLLTGSSSIIPVVLSTYYSQTESGFYSITYRILSVPFIVITSSVTNVYLLDVVNIKNNNKSYTGIFLKTLSYIIPLGVIIYILTFFLGEYAIKLFLGDKWAGVGFFVKALSILLFFDFITTVFKSNTYIVANKQKLGFQLQFIASFTFYFCLIYFSRFSLKISFGLYTLFSVIFSIINLMITYKYSKLTFETKSKILNDLQNC